MAIQVDSLSGLQAFAAAAEARSFRVAGQALGISSSAVGKAIARLEEQLSIQLFHRTTRTISLTETGGLYLARVKNVLEGLEEAESEIAHASADPRGRLRLSLPLTGAVLTRPLADFAAMHPQIELDLDFSDRLVDVIEEGFDAVIRTGEPADSRLKHRRLGSFKWQLVATPDYLERSGTPKTASDLSGHACLRQRLSTGRLAPWPLAGAAEAAIPATLTASIIDPLLDLARAGAGIGAFPDFMVKPYIEDSSLDVVLDELLDRSGTLNILWASGRFQTPKTRAFIDFFVAWASRIFGG